jgi:hypothetical protein
MAGNPNQPGGNLSPVANAFLGMGSPQTQSNSFMPAPQPGIAGQMQPGAMRLGMPTQTPPAVQAPAPQAMAQGLSSPSPAATIGPPAAPMSTGDHSFSTGYPAPNDAATIAATMARYGGVFRGAALPGGGGFRQP